jgi:hypothetical protein
MSLLKGAEKMKTKPEIKEKLEQVEKTYKTAGEAYARYLDGVITALRWVLSVKITQEPKDPTAEE